METDMHVSTRGHARLQRGAVLYIALIMLVLLALLGLVAMQVSGMQERMSANYRAVNLAFQGSEALARNAECALEGIVNRNPTTGCTTTVTSASIKTCESQFEPGQWATERLLTQKAAINVRAIGPCISGNTMVSMGVGPVNEDPNPIYQVTAFSVDDDANPTAQAVIDTVFRP